MEKHDIEKKFWSHLKSDMTVMLGLPGFEQGMSRPMTAQLDEQSPGVIWFFTSVETALAQKANAPQPAQMVFASKGHELFASVGGRLQTSRDRGVIDRLWNTFIAAWFEQGKDDPKLILLRFEPDEAQVWLNEHSLLAGIRLLMGRDPKQDYKDKVAKIDL